MSTGFLFSPLIDLCIRTWGHRPCLLLGVVLEVVALIGSSFATQVWHLFLAQGAAFGLGMGFLYLGTVGFLPQWLKRRGGLANALASSGSGMGGLIYSLATESLLAKVGYARALQILAAIVFVLTSVAVLLLRERHPQQKTKRLVIAPRLLHRGQFLLLCGFSVLSIFAYTICLFLLPSYATSIGLTAKQGSIAAALLSVGQIIGRPIVGFCGDRWNRCTVSSIATFLAGLLSFVMWTFANTYQTLLAFSVLVGCVA